MRTRRLLIATVTASLLLVAGAGATALAIRSSPYVRLVRIRGGVTVKLTALGRRLLRPQGLRGAVLTSGCIRLISTPEGDVPGSGSSAEQGTTNRHGQTVAITVLDTHADFCSVSLDHPRRNSEINTGSGPPFANIAFTRRGAIFLDEDRVCARLIGVLALAAGLAPRDGGAYPSAAALAALSRGALVALPTPAATPPAGRVGVYSDGRRHLEAVGVTALGRRLYVDQDAGVFSTNAATHVFRVTGGQVATLGG